MRMGYKTLIIERGAQGRRLKRPLRIRVREQQDAAEKKLLDYILESLSGNSRLIPFTLENFSARNLARHLLFSRTGSQLSLLRYIESVYHFSKWIEAQPDQLVNKCRNGNGDPNPSEMATMMHNLDMYIDHMQANNFSPNSIRSYLKSVVALFNVNGVGLRMAYGMSSWNVYEDRAPSREEIQKILDLADLRDRVIITILAVCGLRVGTLLKLQYRHVKQDLERNIVPIHVHVEAELTKHKHRSFDTFLNDEASDCLRSYIEARKRGTQKIPPEQIQDESPLIRAKLCKQVKTVTVGSVQGLIHDLYVKAGILENNSLRKRYELRTHSFRKFFRTQMASLDVDRDCIDFMMGRSVKDRYHDVRMKGVEYLRGVYLNSRISIRPKIKMNRIDALKEIIQAWGLNPEKILTNEALAQLTSTTEMKQASDKDLLFWLKPLQNHQSNGFSPESSGAHK